MARVYVSIGSNIERERQIRSGVNSLSARFGRLELSPVYESEAVGFEGENFYNLVAAFESREPVRDIAAELRRIEDRHGRDRSGPRFSSRTLDIDLLLYDGLVVDEPGLAIPRDEITRNAFVLLPLADIAADQRHPVLGETFGELWERFDSGGQKLWQVPFDWEL